jgi:hypothetical protein
MRRWAAVLVLVGLTSAPVLGAYCEVSCAGMTPPVAAVPSCHETAPAGAGPLVQRAEDCGDHAAAPAILTGVRTDRTLLTPSTLSESSPADLRQFAQITRRLAADPHRTPPHPLPPGTAVLRI